MGCQRCPYESTLSHSFLKKPIRFLNSLEHSFFWYGEQPKGSTASSGCVHQLIISTRNRIYYCDKYKAKRFRWQEAFASSKYRSSFSRAGCERNILSHPSRLMALTGHGWGKDFTQNSLISINFKTRYFEYARA